jgi:hypothetical protein
VAFSSVADRTNYFRFRKYHFITDGDYLAVNYLDFGSDGIPKIYNPTDYVRILHGQSPEVRSCATTSRDRTSQLGGYWVEPNLYFPRTGFHFDVTKGQRGAWPFSRVRLL